MKTYDIIEDGITYLVIESDYAIQYRLNNKLHRILGPAIITKGKYKSKYYYQNDFLHREDGPAAILEDKTGSISLHYYLDGKIINSESEYNKFLKMRIFK